MRLASKNSIWSFAVAFTAVLNAVEMEPRETTQQAAFRMNTSE